MNAIMNNNRYIEKFLLNTVGWFFVLFAVAFLFDGSLYHAKYGVTVNYDNMKYVGAILFFTFGYFFIIAAKKLK